MSANWDAVREQLAAEFVSIGLDPGSGYYADALLPVVDRIANERAAAELEAAAEVAWEDSFQIARDLRAQAAALRASNGTDR